MRLTRRLRAASSGGCSPSTTGCSFQHAAAFIVLNRGRIMRAARRPLCAQTRRSRGLSRLRAMYHCEKRTCSPSRRERVLRPRDTLCSISRFQIRRGTGGRAWPRRGKFETMKSIIGCDADGRGDHVRGRRIGDQANLQDQPHGHWLRSGGSGIFPS